MFSLLNGLWKKRNPTSNSHDYDVINMSSKQDVVDVNKDTGDGDCWKSVCDAYSLWGHKNGARFV